jgi:hypothetical protein
MRVRHGATYVLVGGVTLFHLAAAGIWPERLPEGIGVNSGKMAVERSKLTPHLRDKLKFLAFVGFLTAVTGSLQTFNVPADWNSGNNTVETIGAGGSGATGSGVPCTGGGGGAYSLARNIVLTPGGTCSYQLGTGGAAVTNTTGSFNGNAGGSTWFNGATFGAASVGALGGGAGITSASNPAAGAGGASSGGIGSTKNSGGNGGTPTGGAVIVSTGGGGAAGPNGNGNNGVGIGAVNGGTSGGSGDAGLGGAAGAGVTNTSPGGAGSPGAEYSATGGGTAGSGGGGGASYQTSAAATGGTGGLYGGGGGAAVIGIGTGPAYTSGAGAKGLIVYTYAPPAPVVGTAVPLPVLVTLIPPPPGPTFGRNLQPYQPVVLTPPISGPPPPPDPTKLGMGRSQAPWATFQAWDNVTWSPTRYDLPLGRGQFWEPRKLAAPPSGPAPQNPPFPGPQTGLPPAIIDAWIPPPPYTGPMRWVKTPPSGPLTPNSGSLFVLFNQIVSGQNLTWCDFDLYTIKLFNGGVLRFTTADFDINVNGTVYSSQGVRVDQGQNKSQAHWKIGFDVDTWTVVLMPRPIDIATGTVFPDVIGVVPWIQAAHSGYLDAADFQVDRAFFSAMPTWPMTPGGAVPTGVRTIFAGKVQAVDCTDLIVVITANDYRDLLSIQMPLHFYSAQCRHTLFDPGCNADGNMTIGRFSQAGTAGAGSTQFAIIPAGGLPNPGGSGTYTLGTVTMLTGANATFSRTVSTWDGVTLKLVAPFPFTINPGDTFAASAGCDLQRTTCTAFGNLQNFGGQPYIPAPEVTGG